MITRLAKFILLATAACFLSSCAFVHQPIAISLQITPNEVLDAPAGQPCLLFAEIEGVDVDAGSAVTVSASATDADISPCTWQLSGDGIIEFAVTPDPASTGNRVQVVLVAEIEGTVRQDICVLHVTDALSEDGAISRAREAEEIRHEFYEWMIETCPSIPAETSGAWTGIPIRPHRLVVSHYVFFSGDWEIVIWWHVTTPPHDWARIYIRRRFTDRTPWIAAEISSLLNGELPRAIDPPELVFR